MSKVAFIHLSFDTATFEEQLDFMSFQYGGANILTKRYIYSETPRSLYDGVQCIDSPTALKNYTTVIVFNNYLEGAKNYKFLTSLRRLNYRVIYRCTRKENSQYIVTNAKKYSRLFDSVIYSLNDYCKSAENFWNEQYQVLSFNLNFIKRGKVIKKDSIVINLESLTRWPAWGVIKNLRKVNKTVKKIYIIYSRYKVLQSSLQKLDAEVINVTHFDIGNFELLLGSAYMYIDYTPINSIKDLSVLKNFRWLCTRYGTILCPTYKLDPMTTLSSEITKDVINKYVVTESLRLEEIDRVEKVLEQEVFYE